MRPRRTDGWGGCVAEGCGLLGRSDPIATGRWACGEAVASTQAPSNPTGDTTA